MEHPTTLPNSTEGTPDQSSMSTIIFGIVVYVVIGIFGLVGNGMVMVVFGFLVKQKSRVNTFIFSQALIDCCSSILLIAFGVVNAFRSSIMAYEVESDSARDARAATVSDTPASPEGRYLHLSSSTAEFLCRFWWSRFFLFSCFVISTWNLTTMSIERYFAVLHPFKYSQIFTKRRALVMIAIVWLCAPLTEYVSPIFKYTQREGECDTQPTWTRAAGISLGLIHFILVFVVPVCIMAFVYIMIIREMGLKKDALHRKGPGDTPDANNDSSDTPLRSDPASKVVHPSRNITMTLCILFAVYVICWTPNQITFLQYNLGGPLNFSGAWYQFTVIMVFLNCCVNPFIYAFRLKKFQKGVRMLVAHHWHRQDEGDSTTESTKMNKLEGRTG
ncbi:kappa-type opioid receptor-like [Diadema antillarum]|uniref:kappa-type opioid receptor-like n=1 Tax=Diadema antillarum TaxID=105358 RepID=UPI003A864FAF